MRVLKEFQYKSCVDIMAGSVSLIYASTYSLSQDLQKSLELVSKNGEVEACSININFLCQSDNIKALVNGPSEHMLSAQSIFENCLKVATEHSCVVLKSIV